MLQRREWLVLNYFTKGEKLLLGASVFGVVASFLAFDGENLWVLAASLIGVTSLIFNAKGNPVGQLLMVAFSVLYGIISYSLSYYGEMITYLGMTAPMAVFALISWLRHPYKKAQVRVARLTKREGWRMVQLTAGITLLFYFVLAAFDTAHLPLSTLSVATSFLAVYLTYKRSALFAAAYAANDVVLIALWLLAARSQPAYYSVVLCFAFFLINDLYGLVNWSRMYRQQTA